MDPNYRLNGNLIQRVEAPVIGNLVNDELGKLVLAKLNERFKGVPNIEFTREFKKDQPITHSNVPRVLAIDQILKEEGLDIHVLSLEEVVRYQNAIPERGTTYSDTNSVIIYPKEGSNEDLRQKALQLVGKSFTEVPLVVSGLGVERADNNLGFTFTQTDHVLVREAPYLTKDCMVALNEDGKLVESDQDVSVWIPSDQSGLRRLARSRGLVVSSSSDGLAVSDDCGRVQLFSARGRSD